MNTNETIKDDAERMREEIADELDLPQGGKPAEGDAAAATAAGDGDGAGASDKAAETDAADGADGDGGDGGEGEDALDPELLRAVAGEGDGGGPMIPKARFDEATGELKDRLRAVEETAAVQRAEREALLKPLGEPRDFAKERAELKERFNNGDDELSLDDYLEAREQLTLEEAEYKARAAALHASAEAQRIAREQQWEERINKWSEANAELLGISVIRQEVEAFLAGNDDQKISDDDLIKKLDEHVKATVGSFRKLFGGQPESAAAASAADTAADPHAERNKRDAAAAAAASAVPGVASGGVGERGKSAELDRGHLTREQWDKLPESEKQRLLGED